MFAAIIDVHMYVHCTFHKENKKWPYLNFLDVMDLHTVVYEKSFEFLQQNKHVLI